MAEQARTREQVAELVMKVFDRLESGEFKDRPVLDAVLLVEVDAGEDTTVLLECTSDRATIQLGIIQFARDYGVDVGEQEDDDDVDDG